MTDHLVAPGATWSQLAPVLRSVLGGDTADALVVATSGSSGSPKRVRLPGTALRASGEATARVVGGHGRWVLALPTHHVAGLQVLARSVLAGTEPVAVDPGMPFRPDAFAEAVARLGEETPRLTSLVPTQLGRLLDDEDGVVALRRVTVLLGGAAADPGMLARARESGARVVTTYGMSETCGGCVYDGVPLPGVRVHVDPADDRVGLGGPVVADGYPGLPGLTAERFRVDADGTRWFRTDDRGRWDGGRLTVLGRLDDVVVTGGHKVEPRDVETALRALPGVADALVVGVPDTEWGQRVAALLVPAPGGPVRETSLDHVRTALSPTLPPHALPRQVGWRDAIPLLPSGKPDRAAALALLADAGGGNPQGAVAE